MARARTRSGRAASTATLAAGMAIGLATLATPATAAIGAVPAIDPIDPDYEQSALCLKDNRALDSLTDGVGWAQRMLGLNQVSDLSLGGGVTVAVLDTGVNPQKPLAERLQPGGDLLWAAAPSPGLADCDGHGTIVAGIIAGAADTVTGFTGVAPDAQILSIRVTSRMYNRKSSTATPAAGLQAEGVGTPDMLAAAIDQAVTAGAKVINISTAICGPALSTNHPGIEAAVARATAADVVVVAAAGNVGTEGKCSPQNGEGAAPVTAALPARIDSVLTVGAAQSTGAMADFSLRGHWVDVAAPGEAVLSINPHPDRDGQINQILTGQGFTPISGTSFAAPYVSGVAALVRARFPNLTAAQVAHRIEVTASHPAGPAGRNDGVGAGVVNPRRALTAVLPEEGPAGTPLPLAAQGKATASPSSSNASGAGGPGASLEPSPRASALAPMPAAPDPFAGRTAALVGAGALLALLGLGLLHRLMRRRARAMAASVRTG